MSKIKNVIFDLGGVLLNIDFNKTTEAFRKFGFPHFEKMYSQFSVDKLFEKLERGIINPEDFYTVMLKVGNKGLAIEQVKFAWNSLLLNFREESLQFLNQLKKTHNLFLLSNTNAIHFDAFNIILKEQTGFETLDSFFTKTYYSHLIGLRKPDEDIFDFVIENADLAATETLFIDDTAVNINTARKMGFKTHLLVPGEKIERISYDII